MGKGDTLNCSTGCLPAMAWHQACPNARVAMVADQIK
jgi:hypothetical protein